MYRRLKNILGVSLMILAVVISQVPMPEAQAGITKEMTETEMQVDDASAHVVTFSMNGGTFNGDYNGYGFRDKMPVLVIDDGNVISSFPNDKFASYSGYKTESNTWYSDKECLTKYDTDSSVKQSFTLYKKWYNITSDGNTLAARGFHISADGTVLYQYDGDEPLVEIPQTVSVIADGAFDDLDQNVRGIVLPANIAKIGEDAFGSMKDATIIYIYGSGTPASQDYGKQLAEKYEQLVYSEFYDPDKIAKIAGIDYLSDASGEEGPETPEGSSGLKKSNGGSVVSVRASETGDDDTKTTGSSVQTGDNTETQDSGSGITEDNTQTEDADTETTEDADTETTEDDAESSEGDTETTEGGESPTESDSQGGSSSEIVIEQVTVKFEAGIPGVSVKDKEVFRGEHVPKAVSVDGEPEKSLQIGRDQIKKDDGKQETIYTFKGWYKDSSFTEEWDFSDDVVEQDTTLYADWDRQTRAYFNVTYYAAEGSENASGIPGKQKLYEGEKLEKPAGSPSVADKTFKGWYTSAVDTSSEFTSWGKTLTADLALYAHFEENTNTVVFHMNGGGFTGNYNGTSYTDAASLKAEIAVGKGISSAEYPGSSNSSSFKYSNYSTDSDWYKDKECLEVYAQKDSGGNDTIVKGNLTLYKKWYYTSSGFTMNTSNNILYKYSGSVADVVIPDSVTIIGSNAFASVGGISSITLPDNISDVKADAFSGVNKVSKDIIITGKSENAKNVAKGLANQYTRLVYKDSGASEAAQSDVSIISKAASGSIKLGATISGSIGTTGTSTTLAANTPAMTNNTPKTGTIALGTSSVGTTTSTSTQPATTASQSATVDQKAEVSAQQSPSGSPAAASSGAKTTQKQNATSASAPKSTQHIKDSTPKTGDPLQYRMLVVCAMFSVGVLLILTGNGKKKKFSAS